jgi:periplasmic protein TonB
MSSVATYRPSDSLRWPLSLAVVLHAALLAFLVVGAALSHRGENWGGPGGSITVGVVGGVPAIPLPHPEMQTPSRVVDESKGLYKAEPPKIEPRPPDALPIPKFKELKPPPKYVTRPSKILENPTPPPPNAIPYGGGGAPSVPTTSFAMGAGTTQAGLSLNGVGGGDFGSRFDWYVRAVQQRISSNWLQSTVDPSVSVAPRVIVTFTILRDGSVTNIQITRSSNNNSVDTSAVRAVRESSPLQPLPGAYAGSNVNVEFWFDFHR